MLLAVPLVLVACNEQQATEVQAAAPADAEDGYSNATATDNGDPEPMADGSAGATAAYSEPATASGNMDENESRLLTNTRQLITTGARSGEG